MKPPNAYTLGNPVVYDAELEKGTLHKARGGAVFPTHEKARAALDRGKFLPAVWFPEAELPIPGAVYGLEVDFNQVAGEPDEVGARTLLWPARITGKVTTP